MKREVLLAIVVAGMAPQHAFGQNIFDALKPQAQTGMPSKEEEARALSEYMKDPKKRKDYISFCMQLLTVTFKEQCKKSMPLLDPKACGLPYNKAQAKQQCEIMANGGTISPLGR